MTTPAGDAARPTPDDTVDLRTGAPLHEALLALLPLVGEWEGRGIGVAPASGDLFHYRQHIRFAHDGRPFLAYTARSWLVAEDGTPIRPAWRESGFWRPGAGQDDVEVVLASNTGQALVLTGTAGDQQWDLATRSAVPTPTAKQVDAEKRLYAVRDERLVYATELAPAGRASAPHLNADLQRI